MFCKEDAVLRQITDIKELQTILLGALQHFDAFCRQHGLRYFLANGTLLGAAKYEKFIPWDDDVDILMPRESYEKLLEIYNNGGKYRLLSEKTAPGWRLPYAKLTDTDTVQREGEYDFGAELGVSVDIFPLDRWHPGKTAAKLQALWCECLKRMLICANGPGFSTEKRGIKRLILWLLWAGGKTLGTKRLLRLIRRRAESAARYPKTHIGCVVWTCHGAGEVLSAALFEETLELRFCGGSYPAPAGYAAYLCALYGDWKAELPADQQKSNHTIRAWRKYEE